jgi:hypothetical protein
MASEFNYARAWRELAKPAFDQLDDVFIKLYEHIVEFGREWTQDSALNVPIPDRLYPQFAELSPYKLAVAARVIHFWGHWAHAGDAHAVYVGIQKLLFPQQDARITFTAEEHGDGGKAYRAARAWIKEQAASHEDQQDDDWTIEQDRNGPTDSTRRGGARRPFTVSMTVSFGRRRVTRTATCAGRRRRNWRPPNRCAAKGSGGSSFTKS